MVVVEFFSNNYSKEKDFFNKILKCYHFGILLFEKKIIFYNSYILLDVYIRIIY